MSHQIQCITGKSPAIGQLADSWLHALVVDLREDVSLIALTDEWLYDIEELAGNEAINLSKPLVVKRTS